MLDTKSSRQLRAFRAAASGLFIVFILTAPFSLSAQHISVVNYKSQAEVLVFETEYRSQADVIVYKTNYRSQAKGNEGIWFYTKYVSQSDKKVFFTQYRALADVKVYFTTYRSQAKWVNLKKKHLFH